MSQHRIRESKLNIKSPWTMKMINENTDQARNRPVARGTYVVRTEQLSVSYCEWQLVDVTVVFGSWDSNDVFASSFLEFSCNTVVSALGRRGGIPRYSACDAGRCAFVGGVVRSRRHSASAGGAAMLPIRDRGRYCAGQQTPVSLAFCTTLKPRCYEILINKIRVNQFLHRKRYQKTSPLGHHQVKKMRN